MTRRIPLVIALLALLPLLWTCAAKQPVLYPNAKLSNVGPATAKADISDCIALANTSGATSDKTKQVATQTAQGAAIGGATGAVSGAIFGNAGRGAAAGAAGGATAGLTHGIFNANEPDPIFRRFVDRCLRDKGYEPIGWK